MTEIVVPCSTSNLGASFDTCGLALSLYLRVGVEEKSGEFEVVPHGEGAATVARDETNLIVRVAKFVAMRRRVRIPAARLTVRNEIPFARGLGSSSCAIIAGISVYEALSGERLSEGDFFGYAMHYEDHGDNLAPCRLGGLVVACVVRNPEQEFPALLTVRRAWPGEIKVVIAVPDFEMETAKMRAVLPKLLPLSSAIYNIQRAALFQAAIAEGRYELLGEALRDQLHQPYRAPLGAGLEDILRMNDDREKFPGLLGTAISGAGSTMIAFATGNCDEIAAAMKSRIAAHGASARTMELQVDNNGRQFNA
ncbi:MAG: homoserine kinase [Blastocatellia bacterium]